MSLDQVHSVLPFPTTSCVAPSEEFWKIAQAIVWLCTGDEYEVRNFGSLTQEAAFTRLFSLDPRARLTPRQQRDMKDAQGKDYERHRPDSVPRPGHRMKPAQGFEFLVKAAQRGLVRTVRWCEAVDAALPWHQLGFSAADVVGLAPLPKKKRRPRPAILADQPRPSEEDLHSWYAAWIQFSIAEGLSRSRDDDADAALAHFRCRGLRNRLRELRDEMAPKEWKAKGRRRTSE